MTNYYLQCQENVTWSNASSGAYYPASLTAGKNRETKRKIDNPEFRPVNLQAEVAQIVDEAGKNPAAGNVPVFKVKTVFIADLVGSTAAKEKLGHAKGIKRCLLHNDLAAKTIEKYHGRVVKSNGDSVLAVFPNSFNAVLAAVVFRSVLENLTHSGEEFNEPLETRIALTTGTVEEIQTFSGYDIIGQVVDMADRLQKIAQSGQILAEAGAVKLIRPKIEMELPFIKISENRDADEIPLKGFADKVQVSEVTLVDRPFHRPSLADAQHIPVPLQKVNYIFIVGKPGAGQGKACRE